MLDSYHIVIKEFIALHEIYRRIGFPSDSISVQYNAKNSSVYVLLNHQNLEFVADLGKYELDNFTEACTKAITEFNTSIISNEDFKQLFENSYMYKQRDVIIASLLKKGFEFPAFLN